MRIAQIIDQRASSDIVSIDCNNRLGDAVRLLAEKRIGALPVMERGAVLGILSERDVIYCLAAEGDASLARPVTEVMTSPAITVERETTVDQALALMTKRRVRHLPVMEGARMCGFISIGDLVKSRFDEVEHEARALRDYISTA